VSDESVPLHLRIKAFGEAMEHAEATDRPVTTAQGLSRMLWDAREAASMLTDIVESRIGRRDAHLRLLIERIDRYRAERGWNPSGFGGEEDPPGEATQGALLATRTLVNGANSRLRILLLSALGLDDDGVTPLPEYVNTLIEHRNQHMERANEAARLSAQARDQADDLRAQIGRLQEQIEIVESDRTELQTEVERLTQEMAQASADNGKLIRERRELEAGLRASVQMEWRVVYNDKGGNLVVWSTSTNSEICERDLKTARSEGYWPNARAQMRALWASGWVDFEPGEGRGSE
jgi:hypothetical protein